MSDHSNESISHERYVVVMRHSKRKDDHELPTDDPLLGWQDRLDRPHDAPIVDFLLPESSASALLAAAPVRILELKVSPYRRCLQTAAALAPLLRPWLARVEADRGLSEVALRARNAFGSVAPSPSQFAHLPLERMRGIFEDAQELGEGMEVCGDEVSAEETPAESMARFQKTVGRYVRECPHDVLVVTHGDCLNAVANMHGKIIIEAPECSWMVIRCSDQTIAHCSDGLLMIDDL